MSDASGLQSLVKSGVVNFGLASDDYATYRPGFPPRFFEKIAKAITEYRAVSAANSVAKTASAEDKAAAAKMAAAADAKVAGAAGAAAAGAGAGAGAAGAGAAAATAAGGGAAWDWAGKHVLDLGTGPGIVALECAARGATVVGVDIAANQIAAAVKRAKALGLEAVSRFHVGTAEQTGQPSGAFDIVLAGQCWPWFKPAEAMPEIKRVLKPGGVFVIGQFCYLPHRSALAHDTEQLILTMNPAWSMHGFDGLYPKQVDTLVVHGKFELIEQFSFDHAQPFTHAGWRGRIRTCNGVGSGGMTDADVAVFDQRLAKLMAEKYPAEPQNVWHRVWGVIVHT